MNKSRWMFEAYQISLGEIQKTNKVSKIGELGLKAMQAMLINLLGLNLEPIEDGVDERGSPKFRWPTETDFTPLILSIARPDYMKRALEKIENMNQQPEGGTDELMSEGDLEFFDNLDTDIKKAFWDSPETQTQLKQLVIQKDPTTLSEAEMRALRPEGMSEADKQKFILEHNRMVPKRPKFTVDDDIEDVFDWGELKKDI